jgi:hypothetical protein
MKPTSAGGESKTSHGDPQTHSILDWMAAAHESHWLDTMDPPGVKVRTIRCWGCGAGADFFPDGTSTGTLMTVLTNLCEFTP